MKKMRSVETVPGMGGDVPPPSKTIKKNGGALCQGM
jgi:hypothetical protein